MVSQLVVLALLAPLNGTPQTVGQTQDVPLENVHVAAMVQSRMSEQMILYVIQTRPSKFDTSPGALDALENLGVSATILRAIVAVSQSPPAGSGTPAAAAAVPTALPAVDPAIASPFAAQQPSLFLIRGEDKQPLATSQAQVTQVKANMGDDFKSVATSMAAQQLVLEVGARAIASTALKFGSTAAGALAGPLVAASMLFHKAPTYTFVLALPGSQAPTRLHGNGLKVELRYDEVPGVNPDVYEPLLLMLTPTKSNLRLVRAQKFKLKNEGFVAGKERVLQAAVPATVTKLARGHATIEATGLAPGEYGVILRNLGPSETLLYPQTGFGASPYDPGTVVWDFSIATTEEAKLKE